MSGDALGVPWVKRMASKLTLGFSVLLLLPVAAIAQDEQRSIDAHPNSNVSISNVAGSVEVSGWSRNEVDVNADLGSGVEELVVERDGNDIVIRVKVPRNNARNISSDLVIRVPENSNLDVGAVSADVEVTGVFGEQDLHSVSGDVETEAFDSDLTAETVSGDIDIKGDGGAIVAQLGTVSGDVDVRGVAGEMDVNSVSGDLTIEGDDFERVKSKTVNGEFVFRGALESGGRFDAESINGRIDVVFDGAVSARFDIETFNGRIRNCFGPEPKRTSRYAPGRELKFTQGEGKSRVTLSTLNGSLTLCRE